MNVGYAEALDRIETAEGLLRQALPLLEEHVGCDIQEDAPHCYNVSKQIEGFLGGVTECDHDWIDARNKSVQSGEWCRKCNAVRAGNHAAHEKEFPEQTWLCERCKSQRCRGRRITVGFSVSDDDWAAVVGDENTCWCLTCFDEAAQAKGVRYTLLDLHPVTWVAAVVGPAESETHDG